MVPWSSHKFWGPNTASQTDLHSKYSTGCCGRSSRRGIRDLGSGPSSAINPLLAKYFLSMEPQFPHTSELWEGALFRYCKLLREMLTHTGRLVTVCWVNQWIHKRTKRGGHTSLLNLAREEGHCANELRLPSAFTFMFHIARSKRTFCFRTPHAMPGTSGPPCLLNKLMSEMGGKESGISAIRWQNRQLWTPPFQETRAYASGLLTLTQAED